MVRDTIFHVDKKQIKETKPTPPSPNPPSQKKPLRNSIFLEKPIGDQKAKTLPHFILYHLVHKNRSTAPVRGAEYHDKNPIPFLYAQLKYQHPIYAYVLSACTFFQFSPLNACSYAFTSVRVSRVSPCALLGNVMWLDLYIVTFLKFLDLSGILPLLPCKALEISCSVICLAYVLNRSQQEVITFVK